MKKNRLKEVFVLNLSEKELKLVESALLHYQREMLDGMGRLANEEDRLPLFEAAGVIGENIMPKVENLKRWIRKP